MLAEKTCDGDGVLAQRHKHLLGICEVESSIPCIKKKKEKKKTCDDRKLYINISLSLYACICGCDFSQCFI